MCGNQKTENTRNGVARSERASLTVMWNIWCFKTHFQVSVFQKAVRYQWKISPETIDQLPCPHAISTRGAGPWNLRQWRALAFFISRTQDQPEPREMEIFPSESNCDGSGLKNKPWSTPCWNWEFSLKQTRNSVFRKHALFGGAFLNFFWKSCSVTFAGVQNLLVYR